MSKLMLMVRNLCRLGLPGVSLPDIQQSSCHIYFLFKNNNLNILGSLSRRKAAKPFRYLARPAAKTQQALAARQKQNGRPLTSR
ncbi:MAG: hypothetical protein ACRERY_14795, partial [Pseudomonas sp.]